MKEPVAKKCPATAAERAEGANCKLAVPGISPNHLVLPACRLHAFPALAALPVASAAAHSRARLLPWYYTLHNTA